MVCSYLKNRNVTQALEAPAHSAKNNLLLSRQKISVNQNLTDEFSGL